MVINGTNISKLWQAMPATNLTGSASMVPHKNKYLHVDFHIFLERY